MSQVPVKWCCSADLQDKPEAIAVYGDEPVPVVELSALREVVEKMCDEVITKMEATEQPSCSCYLDGLNNLLAMLGEQ